MPTVERVLNESILVCEGQNDQSICRFSQRRCLRSIAPKLHYTVEDLARQHIELQNGQLLTVYSEDL